MSWDDAPPAPEDLSERATEVWRRVVSRHPEVATDPRLRVYCEAVERYEAAANLKPDQLLVRSGKGLASNPLHQVIRENVALMQDIGRELDIMSLDAPPGADVRIAIAGSQEFDPEVMCGATRKTDDKPGPRYTRGKIVIRPGGGKGRPCRNRKGAGTKHKGVGRCKRHDNVRYAVHDAAQMAANALAKMGVAVQIDPQQALLEMVWESAGNVAFLRARVQALPDVATSRWGRTEAHVLVRMYSEERDRLARICKLAIDAGIEERAISLAEQQADAMVNVVTRVLDALELSSEQRAIGQSAAVAALSEFSEVDPRQRTPNRN